MINVALPFIMKSFSTTLAKVEWVVLSYLLTITISLLIWGQISDRFGKGVIYLLGMLVFSIGCLCCYFSPCLEILVFSRFVQGVGAAMMMSSGPAIIRLTSPRQHIGKWLGSLGIATSMGLMSGPLFGGFIIHNFDWRTIFLLNVPVSFLVFLLGWIFLAGKLPKYIDAKRRFDWVGSVFWVVMIATAVLLLNTYSHGPLWVKGAGLLLFLVIMFAFLVHELKQVDPLFPVSMLRQKYYSIAMFSSALSFAVLFVILILMPFYLSYVQGFTSDKIGYIMMSVPVTLFFVSPLSGRLFDKIGAKYLTSFGLLITGIAIVLLAMIDETTTIFNICWRLSLLGAGQSIFLSPNTASVLSQVSFENTGTTSGMLATSRNLGMLTGVALAGMIFGGLYFYFSGNQTLVNFTPAQIPAFMKSFRFTLNFAAGVAFIGTFISSRRN